SCPCGVATQDPCGSRCLNVEDKEGRVAKYHANAIKAFLDVVAAMGLEHPDQLEPRHVLRRLPGGKILPLDRIFPFVETGSLLSGDAPEALAESWASASAERFHD
ncbi:MAG: FMN-binding glutamate synthase family protein, partial [Planctomycetes bacterium]|nr:FMN-binding glutamate synthase family protein [Planctomycetota bacterium]